jgi:hypothetical protein
MKMIWKFLDLTGDIEFWVIVFIEFLILNFKWFQKEKLVG